MSNDLSKEEQELYMQELMDNYQNPRNFKKLESYTNLIHQKNSTCGDEFDLYLKINDGKIEDISFFGEGCAISTASFSLLTEKIKGLTIDEIKKINEDDIKKMIGIPISYSRLNCAMLSYNALQDFLLKNNEK